MDKSRYASTFLCQTTVRSTTDDSTAHIESNPSNITNLATRFAESVTDRLKISVYNCTGTTTKQ